jgi:multimeric flavodoxin WrbA
MKVLGIYTGRKEQYSEFITKTALLGAKEAGAEVEIINLLDLNLKPCIGCKQCHAFYKAAVGDCILKDDFPWLDEKIMESDALVVVMPIYEKAPPGEFKILMDRTGPSHDVAFRQWAKKMRQEKDYGDGKVVDERSFKIRPVTFIAHGGTDWGSLAIPMMKVWAIPMGFKIVDTLYYPWNLKIMFEDDKLERIKASGKHVAESVKDVENAEYIGDKGQCPACCSRAFILGDTADEAECAVCGIKGKIEIVNGKVSIKCPNEEMVLSQMGDGGRNKHLEDLLGFGPIIMSMDFEEMGRRKEKTLNWLPLSKPEKSSKG